MLVRESQGLDLQEIPLPQYTVEINTQRMGRQFRVQAGAQASERMRMIALDIELA